MKKVIPDTKRVMDLIKNDKKSSLNIFRTEIPTNDFEYLNHWFRYFDFSTGNYDIITDLIGRYGIDIDKFETQYVLQNQLIEYIEKCHQDVLNQIEFEPRVEKYISLFQEEDRNNLRLLIISNLYKHIHKNDKYIHLLDLANEFRIDKQFVFSLNESHKIFVDKAIEIDNSSIHKDDPWNLRDIYFNPVIFNIFANIEVNPQELAFLNDSSLIQLFDLADPNQIPAYNSDNDDLDDDMNLDEDFNDLDIGGIESLFKDDFDDFEDENEEEENEEENIEEEVIDEDQKPFKDDLDYLYHEYKYFKNIIALQEKRNDVFAIHEKEDERIMHKLEQAIQKQRYINDLKLAKCKKHGFIPRLEKLAGKLNLDSFEKKILKALVINSVFIESRESYSFSNSLSVKEIIVSLIENDVERILAKKHFQKNAKLIKYGIIYLEQRDSLNSSIYDSTISIDGRLVGFLSGEEFNIADHIDGSFLFTSAIQMDQVKLPEEIKQKVLSTINNFPAFLKTKKDMGFSEVTEYGNSLVMLFVGKSGTGKTMLANAISNHLNKKVLLFNLSNLKQMSVMADERQLFSVLFREARMNDAILFFDESEDLLQSRFNDLLIEIEKHEGIVIFATNASFKIDEAMRRRINLIQNLPDPGPTLRKDIWEIHLPKKVLLGKDVNLEQVARRYELNGGLIKNAVYSALAQSVNRASEKKPELSMADLEYGAKEQLHNKLFMSNLERLKVPEFGLDRIVLPKQTENAILEIVNVEKSWKMLETEWGFKDVFPEQKGISVLFHGPSGTGKSATAEAIAYEMGRKLKIVNYSQILSMYVGGTEKALEALFEEVADNESILLFDEADALFAQRTAVTGSTDRYANVETNVLLSLIERFNAFTILTTNYITNIDHAFFRRMSYIIGLDSPVKAERLRLWKILVPSKMPLSDDIDFEELASKYHFTGGDIKNAVIRVATRKAVQMNTNIKISHADFIDICEEIKRNKNNGKNSIGYR